MQRLMRAAIGTHNIDNCSRVCHSPTSLGAAPVARPVRRDRLVRRHRGRRRGDHHRRQPDRGPPGRRRADQAGDAARRCSSSRSTRAASSWRTTRVLHLSPRARAPTPRSCSASRTSSRATGSSTGLRRRAAPRAATPSRTCSPTTRPPTCERISGDPGRRPRARRAHLRRGRRGVDPVGPRRHRAQVRLGGRAADLQPRAHVRQGRPARARRCCRCAGRTTCRARRTWARCPTRSPATSRSLDEDVARRFEARWGVTMKRERGLKIPEMFDAAVAGELKAMYIFGEDVAQTDPNTTHVVAALRGARVPRRAGHLRERDDALRRRRPAGLVVPREERHVHERRAAHPARRRGDRAAGRGAHGLRHPHDDLRRRSATRWPFATPADVMDEVAALTPDWAGVSHERVGRARPAVAGRRRRHRLADPLRGALRAAERPRAARRAALQAAGQRGAATSSRSCSSPAGAWSTTTPAR